MFYLLLMTYALSGNEVDITSSCILFIVYIVHILLMKYSSKYEVALKQMLANHLESKALKKIASNEMYRFHRNMKTEAISIEMLMKVKFNLKGEHNEYMVFEESLFKKKVHLSQKIKSGEEKFAGREDKALMARKNWKQAVSSVIIKLQAYKHNQQILRTLQSRQRLSNVAPHLAYLDSDDETFFGESYYSEDGEKSFALGVETNIEIKEYSSKDKKPSN